MIAGDRSSAPVPGIWGRFAERVYRFEIGRRNRRYDAGRGVERVDVPVISIGNLSVGGTGKTPMVAWTIEQIGLLGKRGCVAMRGYRKQAGGESDEQAEYRRRLPGCPIVAQPDRAAGIRALLDGSGEAGFDVVVLDDGFQHRRLARDLDLVLIDASRDPAGDRLLPAGWLREPVDSLVRADGVVLTHTELCAGDAVDRLEAQVRVWAPGIPVARAAHRWRGLAVADDGVERFEPLEFLRGLGVVVVCGIGHPRAFLDGVASASGRDHVATVVLPDHASYSPSRVARIVELASEGADAIVTTEKDWSKLGRLAPSTWPCPVVRPQLTISVTRGADQIRSMIRSVLASPAHDAG